MGMYVCEPCVKEHHLEKEVEPGRFGGASCEICGPLKDDWSYKSTVWVWRPDRNVYASTYTRLLRLDVQDQLRQLEEERQGEGVKRV